VQQHAEKVRQACRLIEKKGLRTTLRAFAAFAQAYPRATLQILGEGPLLAELQELAGTLGLTNRVFFRGLVSQDELRETFYRSHLFLHPSETGRDGNQEGVPNSMLEAMASGLPVFATTHGGIPEAIKEGVSGVMVAEGDDKALSQALLEAVQRPDRLATMAEAGAETVSRNFEQASQVKRLEEIYLETIRA
jgi:glycosyltransferase involved in cell wall biosynthesis